MVPSERLVGHGFCTDCDVVVPRIKVLYCLRSCSTAQRGGFVLTAACACGRSKRRWILSSWSFSSSRSSASCRLPSALCDHSNPTSDPQF
eukprot:1366130-Rhodomonas_salina.7